MSADRRRTSAQYSPATATLDEAARIAQCAAERTSFTRALHVVRRSVIDADRLSLLGTQP